MGTAYSRCNGLLLYCSDAKQTDVHIQDPTVCHNYRRMRFCVRLFVLNSDGDALEWSVFSWERPQFNPARSSITFYFFSQICGNLSPRYIPESCMLVVRGWLAFGRGIPSWFTGAERLKVALLHDPYSLGRTPVSHTPV